MKYKKGLIGFKKIDNQILFYYQRGKPPIPLSSLIGLSFCSIMVILTIIALIKFIFFSSCLK